MEGITIADMMNRTRDLTLLYLDRLKEKDLYTRFESQDGIRLNSAYWLTAHIAVTQNFLVLHNAGAEKVSIPWARQFGLGSTGLPPEDAPSFEEIFNTLQEVHFISMNFLKTQSADDLNRPTVNGFRFFNDDDSIRSSVMHAIRHEGGHAGQLSWLCKLNGIKLI
jgi:hypothetical protein